LFNLRGSVSATAAEVMGWASAADSAMAWGTAMSTVGATESAAAWE